MRYKNILYLLGVLVLIGGSDLQAQGGKWGVGGFADYNMPLSGLKDRFNSTGKYGVSFSYVHSPTVTIEMEYNHSVFNHGKPASEPFIYPADGTVVTSPNAESSITFNDVALQALVFPGEKNAHSGFKAKSYRFYVLAGGGFFRYESVNKNLVFPGQTTSPIDLTLVMDPQIDRRYAVTLIAGGGIEGFITDNLSLDIRTQYNLVFGELRPLLFYGLERTWPLHLFNVGAGIKFYFWQPS